MTANSSIEPRRPSISLSQWATGLLLLMLLVYALARSWEQAHPALGFVRAFAEAAVVGALADWFAVTALFRRPLGLPLRHTAIIPRNKDRIGAALGRFVEQNYLAPELDAARLAQHQLAGPLAHWLARTENAERVVDHLVNALPPLLRALDNETLRHFVRDAIVARLRRFEAAPLAGQALELLVAEGRHRPLVDAVLHGAVELLREHETEIRERVRANTAWIWQKLSMDERIADRIIAAAEEMLLEVSADPEHPWRQRLDRGVADFALALRESEQYRAQGEAIKQQLLQHPVLLDYLAGVWSGISRLLQDDLARQDSALRARLLELCRLTAEGLERDDALRAQLDDWLRAAIVSTVSAQRHQVAGLIEHTVQQWDGQTMADRIEGQVGADLQFIRINGTLIGGLVGLTLHTVTVLVFA